MNNTAPEARKYPSIQNLYASNGVQGPEHRRGPEFGFSDPGFDLIGKWLVLEKVDGMNMRVVVASDPGDLVMSVNIFGRSDRAQVPAELRASMATTFTPSLLRNVFFDEFGDGMPDVTLFGEGFGPGIQKAGTAYGGEKRFILFDVLINDAYWLPFEDVRRIGLLLGVPVVPVLATAADLSYAKSFVNKSVLLGGGDLMGSPHIEGIVLRTDPYLFNSRGKRVMAKYKVRDL